MIRRRWCRAQECIDVCLEETSATGHLADIAEVQCASHEYASDADETNRRSSLQDAHNSDDNGSSEQSSVDCMTCSHDSNRFRNPKKTPQQRALSKLGVSSDLEVFTCGCGDLRAQNLCELLVKSGIRSVLDVRALSKSKKKPWFNSDSLAKDMNMAGLMYRFVGKGRKSHTVVAAMVHNCEQPVCLLGFRASPLECARLILAQKLYKGLAWKLFHLEPLGDECPPKALASTNHVILFERYSSAIEEIRSLQSTLERRYGLSSHWRSRVLAHYSSIHYEDWDHVVSKVEPTVIELPWGSIMMVLPNFLSAESLRISRHNTEPGMITYEQPHRRRLNSEGKIISYREKHKEAWLCNAYDYADPKRASSPSLFRKQPLGPWAESILEQASYAAFTPFNGLMCRLDAARISSDQGPHSFARGSPMLEYAAIAMLSLSGSRKLRVHGLGCWEKLVVDVPMEEGSLVVFGGPLKERWLYWHMQDSHSQGERVLVTFQLHADSQKPAVLVPSSSSTASADGQFPQPLLSSVGVVQKLQQMETQSKSRWKRSQD